MSSKKEIKNKKTGSKNKSDKRVNTTKRKGKKKKIYRSAARRSAKSRKVRTGVFYTLAIAIILAVCLSLSMTVLFKVVNINAVGLTKYDTTSVINDSGIFKGENIFMCDQENISDKLSTDYPYIESVEVDKKIPDTVTLNITEATPVGYIKYNNNNIVLSSKNKVLEITDQPVTSCAEIKGVEIEDAQLSQQVTLTDTEDQKILNDIFTSLHNQNVTGITEIDVSNESNSKIVYQDRIKIELGSPDNIEEKIKSAMAVINDPSIANNAKGTIDTSMSVTNNRTYFNQDYTV